jgi:hypothetical protein
MLNLNWRDIHDLRTPISNFAMSEFDNPTVLENNVEVRAIPDQPVMRRCVYPSCSYGPLLRTASGRPRIPTTCCRVIPGSSLDICSPIVRAERRETTENVSNIAFTQARLAEAAASWQAETLREVSASENRASPASDPMRLHERRSVATPSDPSRI